MQKITGLPGHIAIIPDGNGRWAEKHGLARLDGHKAGVENIRTIIRHLAAHGIAYATLYAFSTENWNRPREEVDGLFGMLEAVIDAESRELHNNGVKIRHIGNQAGLSPGLLKSITAAEQLTQHNTGMNLGVALNYGGRMEIVEAARRIAAAGVPPQDIDEELLSGYMMTAGFPEVDLVVRTGGEFRSSNFLIWQTAYAEYYFTPVLWPDFNGEELDKALLTYSRRQRRFGGLKAKASCSEKES
jgi:undecaprenyl diphosphate synthase